MADSGFMVCLFPAEDSVSRRGSVVGDWGHKDICCPFSVDVHAARPGKRFPNDGTQGQRHMKRLLNLCWILLVLLPVAHVNAQSMGTIRVLCIKAREGKAAELRKFLLDPTTKLAKYRVENGTYSSFAIAEAVAPAGRSARCDYHLVYGNDGPPAETKASTDEEFRQAGVGMTVAERNAKRDEVSTLISTEYWASRDMVGTMMKGGYARLNYFKVKAGAQAEWVREERSGWKQLAEAWAKDTPGRAWILHTLAMPGGSSQAYNALTVDVYPNWASMFGGGNPRATWVKVHPESDYSAYMDRVGQMSERPMVATMRLLEIIRK